MVGEALANLRTVGGLGLEAYYMSPACARPAQRAWPHVAFALLGSFRPGFFVVCSRTWATPTLTSLITGVAVVKAKASRLAVAMLCLGLAAWS